MRKMVVACLLVTLLATAQVARSQTPAAASLAPTAPITYTGTVTAVDATTRVVTTRSSDGISATWEFPPSVPQAQVDALRVGQVITVTYSDAIGLRRKPAGEAAVDRVEPTTRLRTATVTIAAVDLATNMVTFTGATGRSFTRHVVDPANAAILQGIAVGERVDVSWYETMQLASDLGAPPPPPVVPVAQPTPVADDPDSLRHRLTVSVLWGLDNQFSGKMIQSSVGSTLQGSPIRLDETTFDEVYGRMGLFKAGVGYRLSPRSEAVLNFVLSRSSSEVVNIGTVGTANVPLDVDFGDYDYWGFEAGQRFYFSQVRFTPYVGYLAGFNRFGDIRGTFVNVPAGGANLLPGYAAQDGKFFEKSWALSFSGTGGVLVGVGPFEVMGEVALRYMGGLSDVDWLVEEGLRDINSESSRWSVPVMVGARIRF